MFYKVMIIEDEDIIRNGIKYSIDWSHYNCHVVADTDNAIESQSLIETLRPHILIVDINMPVMSGLELIKKMKPDYDFSTIIISGYNDFDYAQQAIQLDVIRYLSKPIQNNQLIEALELAIKQQKSLQEIQKIRDLRVNTSLNFHYNKISHDELVNDILLFVKENYQKKIKMKDVEASLGYSESTINNRLKQTLGTTFNNYINDYRIHIAISQIEMDPKINLQWLANDVGIPNYKHFSHVFKKYTGFSPREYIVNHTLEADTTGKNSKKS